MHLRILKLGYAMPVTPSGTQHGIGLDATCSLLLAPRPIPRGSASAATRGDEASLLYHSSCAMPHGIDYWCHSPLVFFLLPDSRRIEDIQPTLREAGRRILLGMLLCQIRHAICTPCCLDTRIEADA
jgi:hypothetical protein